MSEKPLTVKVDNSSVFLEALVDQNYTIIEQLENLNSKKNVQINQQEKFQKAWKRTKQIAVAVVIASTLLGFIQPTEDMATIFDRAAILAERVNKLL